MTKLSIKKFNEIWQKGYQQGRADERENVLTQFLFELGKNVAYEKEKIFGTDVIRVDALMTICKDVEQQLKEQNNDNNGTNR